MKWYGNLYVGESIADKSEKVKKKILQNVLQVRIYVIALATNPQNLLDIIPARELLQSFYPKKELFIIGLATGREEAENVAAGILLEVYTNTGGFDVRAYLKEDGQQAGSVV